MIFWLTERCGWVGILSTTKVWYHILQVKNISKFKIHHSLPTLYVCLCVCVCMCVCTIFGTIFHSKNFPMYHCNYGTIFSVYVWIGAILSRFSVSFKKKPYLDTDEGRPRGWFCTCRWVILFIRKEAASVSILKQ
jgi:hypothetical protein